MSLFDALVDEAVLSRPVMQQNYYIALRTDGAKGSGTEDDPWNGSTQAMFDAAMTAVPENSTVFLGPCIFTVDSQGNPVPASFFQSKGYPNGFSVKSGQRIVGSGMGVTLVKLTGHAADGEDYAFSMPMAGGDYLVGFEISDLTIDANLSALSNCIAGGILVRGKHVFIQRVRVQNYGSRNSSKVARGICGTLANDPTTAPPYNTVIADCIVDPPSGNHTQVAHALSLDAAPTAGSMNYHDLSVVRGCAVDGGYDPNSGTNKVVHGIFVNGARGTIIENNQFRNCPIGGPTHAGVTADEVIDLIVRDNYYYNCKEGLNFTVDTTSLTPTNLRRVIIEQNLFDLPAPSGMPGTFPTAVGIKFSVTSQSGAVIFVFVFIRNNRIRGLNGWAVWQGSMGMNCPTLGILPSRTTLLISKRRTHLNQSRHGMGAKFRRLITAAQPASLLKCIIQPPADGFPS